MKDSIAQRLAASIVGLIIGIFIAIGVVVFLGDIDHAWLLVAIPPACAAATALLGERALEFLKQLAWWSS